MKPNLDGLMVTLRGVRYDLALLARDYDHLYKGAANLADQLLLEVEVTMQYRKEKGHEKPNAS